VRSVQNPLPVLGRASIALASVFGAGAILRYPGGDPLDRLGSGYSPTRNFLSDLGMTVAYNGGSNRLGASLFAASLLLLTVGSGLILVHVGRELSNNARSGWFVRAAGIAIVLSCAAFGAVAFTPENQVMRLHVRATLLAWRLVPIGTALLTAAAFSATGVSRASKGILIALTFALTAYVVILGWGPSTHTLPGLRFDVIAQKVASIVLIAGILGLSVSGEARAEPV
jgi:hypothetical protein